MQEKPWSLGRCARLWGLANPICYDNTMLSRKHKTSPDRLHNLIGIFVIVAIYFLAFVGCKNICNKNIYLVIAAQSERVQSGEMKTLKILSHKILQQTT